jgi:hypothetical protein
MSKLKENLNDALAAVQKELDAGHPYGLLPSIRKGIEQMIREIEANLKDAPREAQVHSFIYDISGLKEITLTLRNEQGEQVIPPRTSDAYPSGRPKGSFRKNINKILHHLRSQDWL